MCGSIVDIKSPTAEIRQEKKKKEERHAEMRGQLISASATQGGHNESSIVSYLQLMLHGYYY